LTDNASHWLISGATGFVGSALCAYLKQKDVQVTALSRDPKKAAQRLQVRAVQSTAELDAQDRFDAIVHLSGANVFAWPWTKARKQVLRDSRLNVAQDLLQFCARAKQPPKTWIQASAVGFYPSDSQHTLDERAAPGTGFAAELCQAIEDRAMQAAKFGARVVNLRFGLVLGNAGGVFPLQRLGVKLGGGAVLGSGGQHMSWIHIDDVVGLIMQSVENLGVHGAINAVADECPSNREWTKQLAAALDRPVLWRIPALMLQPFLGQRAPLLLSGAQIHSTAQRECGLRLQFPSLELALRDLCRP
jgi:uncharacterized protein